MILVCLFGPWDFGMGWLTDDFSVEVRWNLHFEFVISDGISGSYARHPDGGIEWTAPAAMDIHTMVWDLPIKVYACNPLHAANAAAAVDSAGGPVKPYSVRI